MSATRTGQPAAFYCPWCADVQVSEPGQLCAQCEQNPDAEEFKAAHDAECACMITPHANCIGQDIEL